MAGTSWGLPHRVNCSGMIQCNCPKWVPLLWISVGLSHPSKENALPEIEFKNPPLTSCCSARLHCINPPQYCGCTPIQLPKFVH